MKRERLKSLLLASLFLISLFLVQQLWMVQFPYKLLPAFGETGALENKRYFLSDIVSPSRILINFRERNHTMVYSGESYNLWNKGKDLLGRVFNNKNITFTIIDDEAYLQGFKNRSINFIFAEELNTYIISNMLGSNIPNTVHDNISKVDSIFLNLGSEFYVVFSDGRKHMKISGTDLDLKSMRKTIDDIETGEYTKFYLLAETFNTELTSDNQDLYIPFNIKYSVPEIYVKNEIDIHDDVMVGRIAEEFFMRDLAYIREIVENNGSVIYVYNQKTLKINQNGLLEFFNSVDEPITERNLYVSLSTAIDFTSHHMGWPSNVYLSNIEEIESEGNKGYRFIFKYRINGTPILSAGGTLTNAIEVEVYNEYVKSYRRLVREKLDEDIQINSSNKAVLSPLEVFGKQENYEKLQKEFASKNRIDLSVVENTAIVNDKILSSIRDVYFAYYDISLSTDKEKLVGVWVINVDGENYIFDIYSGELLYGGNS